MALIGYDLSIAVGYLHVQGQSCGLGETDTIRDSETYG